MLTGSCHCGQTGWTFDGLPNSATACNCTICRRYGTLWAYDWVDEKISTTGTTSHYTWGDKDLEFHFCPTCGCTTWWRAAAPDPEGRRQIAVNLRLSDDPDAIAAIPIRHFEGLVSFTTGPRDDRCVADMWY